MVANGVAGSLRVTKSGDLLDTHRKVVSPDLVLPPGNLGVHPEGSTPSHRYISRDSI